MAGHLPGPEAPETRRLAPADLHGERAAAGEAAPFRQRDGRRNVALQQDARHSTTDRLAVDDGQAELAARHWPPVEVADHHGHLLAQRLYLLSRRILSQRSAGRIARNEGCQEERDEAHQEQERDDVDELARNDFHGLVHRTRSQSPIGKGAIHARTIRLHRVIATRPDKLYRAFLEADAVASWLPPYGFVCTVHELDAKVGGHHRMSFRNFTTGHSHSFEGTYLELVPGERLVYTDRFDDPELPDEMKVTVDLRAVSVGTEVNIEQRGVPDVIPAEACYLGWQDSLHKLTKLIEPEINQ